MAKCMSCIYPGQKPRGWMYIKETLSAQKNFHRCSALGYHTRSKRKIGTYIRDKTNQTSESRKTNRFKEEFLYQETWWPTICWKGDQSVEKLNHERWYIYGEGFITIESQHPLRRKGNTNNGNNSIRKMERIINPSKVSEQNKLRRVQSFKNRDWGELSTRYFMRRCIWFPSPCTCLCLKPTKCP